jgi:Domain of unknown function (DUF4172)
MDPDRKTWTVPLNWQRPGWPAMHVDSAALALDLAQARHAQGQLHDPHEAMTPQRLHGWQAALFLEGFSSLGRIGRLHAPGQLLAPL